MTPTDLNKIRQVLNYFKVVPTWQQIHKRALREGIPHAQDFLKRNPDVKRMKKEREYELKKVKNNSTETDTVFPYEKIKHSNNADNNLLVTELQARIASLEAELDEYRIKLERYAGNAVKLGIPRVDLERPLAVKWAVRK